MLIAVDRKGKKNLGELYKPTQPARLKPHGPYNKPGFQKCKRKCDTCAHAQEVDTITSPWDNRTWKIKQHLTCTTKNIVYIIKCEKHSEEWYVGSSKDLKKRWANHKSHINNNRTQTCRLARHVCRIAHPQDKNLPFLTIIPLETVHQEDRLLEREPFWQANLGTITKDLIQDRIFKMSRIRDRDYIIGEKCRRT